MTHSLEVCNRIWRIWFNDKSSFPEFLLLLLSNGQFWLPDVPPSHAGLWSGPLRITLSSTFKSHQRRRKAFWAKGYCSLCVNNVVVVYIIYYRQLHFLLRGFPQLPQSVIIFNCWLINVVELVASVGGTLEFGIVEKFHWEAIFVGVTHLGWSLRRVRVTSVTLEGIFISALYTIGV